MAYSLFLGCTAPARARNYEISARLVAEKLGVHLIDSEDFACCGFPLRSLDEDAALLLAARNLSIAEQLGSNICTLCSACASSLREATMRIRGHEELRGRINEKLGTVGRSMRGNVEVKHFARVLYDDVGIERIEGSVVCKLSNLKVAAHYGCHYLKPSSIFGFEDTEAPASLDELISATGAVPVVYGDRMDCCGASILSVDEKIPLAMATQKLRELKASDADAVCLICPFCGIVYDGFSLSEGYGVPVLYYTQLLGLALGFKPDELGFELNRADTTKLLENL